MISAQEENMAKVVRFIQANFSNFVSVKNYPTLPGGCLVTDKNNDQMVVYFDQKENKISYLFPPPNSGTAISGKQ